ncbi:MAG: metallophosphoesterase [Clostridia bacterium]|nr:metallophosphoesterase [Clostridia bacterium]
MKQLKFYLITDTHYFKNSLGAYGKGYDEFMRFEQKCYAETQAINRSVIDWLKEADEADIVLIAGDLSFNGEKESHLEFIELLNELKASGKQVFVVSADHDVNKEPFAYNGGERISVEPIDRMDIFDLYYDFGFSQAIAVDKKHLSYVVQLGDGVRLMALNNDYENQKFFDDEQLEWIRTQAKSARDDNQLLFAMNHYPLLPGQPLFSLISSTYQKNSYEVVNLMADEGIHLVFTGHMHNQSINEFISTNGNKLYDVCTSSVIAHPAIIRHVTLSDDFTAQIKSIPCPDFEWDTNGKTCQQYLIDLFDSMILNILEDMKTDPARVLGKFGIGDKKALFPVVKILGKLFDKLTVGTLSRLLFIKCDKSIRKELLKNYIARLVRGVFEGNQTFVEGTAHGDVFINFLNRINPVLKKIKVKGFDGKPADLKEILKHSAGNYGIDDYNTILKLK